MPTIFRRPLALFAMLVLLIIFGLRGSRFYISIDAAQAAGPATFIDSGQALGNGDSIASALGDLDGDGDRDVFVANTSGQPNEVWLNDGNGNFTDSGQALGSANSTDVALGDLDGDGDLDAFVANGTGITRPMKSG